MAAIALAGLVFSGFCFAQDAPPADSELSDAIGAKREALESSDLDDSFKQPAVDKLDEAEGRLKDAQDYSARAEALREATPGLPAEAERLKAELQQVPDSPEAIAEGSVSELRDRYETERAAVAELEAELSEAERKLVDLKARPVEVGTRLPLASAELSRTDAKLSALGDPAAESLVESADRLLLQAEKAALQAETEMLEQEQVGQAMREEVADLEKQLLEAQLANRRSTVVALEEKLKSQLEGEVNELRKLVDEIAADAADADPEIRQLASELPGLVDRLESTADEISDTGEKLDDSRRKLEKLRREDQRLRREVQLGGLEGAFSQVLLDQRRRLPDRRGLDYDLRLLEEEISEAQLAGFRIDDLMAEQRQLEETWEGNREAEPVLRMRGELLDRLGRSQRALIQDLARLGADEKAYRDLTVEFSEFLSEQLFWRRSSKPIGRDFFVDLPGSVGWVFGADRWRSLGESLMSIPSRHPVATVGICLVLIGLVGFRPKLRASIEHSAKRIRRISTDRLVHTLRALLDSLLLAAPVPIALGFLFWALSSEPKADDWVRGIGAWCHWASFTLMWILTLRELSRPGGVGRVHFGWEKEAAEILHKMLGRFALLYLPALLLASLTVFEEDSRYFDSIGRLGFIASQIGITAIFLKMFRPSTGVFAAVVKERPDRLLSKWSGIWYALVVAVPATLAILAALGYALTGMILSEVFQASLRWLGAGVVLYGVLLRWFLIKERRIALSEAIQERKERREAAEKPPEGGEETVTVDDEEIEPKLDEVARQTRRLLRSLIGIGVLVAIWYTVSNALPVDQAAGEIAVAGSLDWLGVMQAILIVLVTFTVVKNLPGLLDLGGMRESGMAPGTRYAVATLCQYALAAIGIFLVVQALEIDGARFGWIAAALSVGLGFGLQEIVANFVCGIIILFERPVRVGDVVTVGEVTGTISRIRMRATTITNWDRQEFVVPNKDFITGSLINWTLSSPVNRLTIEVGVAYGSDTTRAREILTEVATNHPVVLADPAPLITFDQFADSTLNLAMRIYLPNMDNRLKTRTEIHEEIDRRFKEAGIEIAFPQRDLHIRSVPNEMIRGRATEESPEIGDQEQNS
ncbi:potassium transporter [Haloferula helveola]|uniref:Potassium transporter n=1 Tax=Haloferula helveola TaxID=490095 RepID=A0ABM7RMQ2_9BACT|nr:potassium transporter [Haloferula helveola]